MCARAFKHKKYIPEKKVLIAAIGVWEGVRCLGGVVVCGTVLEMGQWGGMCDVSSCTTLTVGHRPLLRS